MEAASVDQTAPATHATANEQRWTKKHLWLLNYSTNKKELEAGMCYWVQLTIYIIVNKTATGFAFPFRFLQINCGLLQYGHFGLSLIFCATAILSLSLFFFLMGIGVRTMKHTLPLGTNHKGGPFNPFCCALNIKSRGLLAQRTPLALPTCRVQVRSAGFILQKKQI